jgi:hypothetical protein
LGKNNNNCQCECTEDLMDKLEDFEARMVAVWERTGDVAQGFLDKVKDGTVVKLVNGVKFRPGTGFSFGFEEVYISACEITEFVPFPPTAIMSQEDIKEFLTSGINNVKT